MATTEKRITKALDIAADLGMVDGDHHKAWMIDQMVRALTDCPVFTQSATDYRGQPYSYQVQGESPEYHTFLARATHTPFGWNEGIAP